ncbi:MAG: CBS domain-containing protein [Nitrosopumilus sp.]|nr:CBS domain-containing protein [Nitrosopumilus sp.]
MQDKKSHFISVSDFMSMDFITVKVEDSLIQVIKKILQMDLDSAIVMDSNFVEDIPVGIIKLKDILRTIIENNAKVPISTLDKVVASDVMSKPLIYAFLNQPIWDVLDLMYSKKVSILPVIDNHDKIQGVVRMNSILKNLSEL